VKIALDKVGMLHGCKVGRLSFPDFGSLLGVYDALYDRQRQRIIHRIYPTSEVRSSGLIAWASPLQRAAL
jgi:hypothetical protein